MILYWYLINHQTLYLCNIVWNHCYNISCMTPGSLRTWHLQPACRAPGDFVPLKHRSVCISAPHTHTTTTTVIRHTHRYDHRVVLFEFGDVFVSSVDLGLVQGPEAAHHPHPALRRIHHGCCCCCCCWHCLHRPSKYCGCKQINKQAAKQPRISLFLGKVVPKVRFTDHQRGLDDYPCVPGQLRVQDRLKSLLAIKAVPRG